MAWLDDLAFVAIGWSDLVWSLVGVGLVACGTLVGAALRAGRRRALGRLPYLMAMSALLLALTSIGATWVLLPRAAGWGAVWVVPLGLAVASVAGGLALGALAQARSVDAFGHGRRAWLAAVPIANLALVFRPGLAERDADRTANAQALVVLGLAVLAMNRGLHTEVERAVHAMAGADFGPAYARAETVSLVRREGLDGALAAVARDTPTGDMGGGLALDRVEADGRTLRLVYRLDPGLVATGEGLAAGACRPPGMGALLSAGATIEFVYLDAAGAPAGRFPVTVENCGAAL